MNRFKESYHSEIIYQFNDDIPENPVQGILYIIGEKKFLWCIVMKCPCGCSDLIHLNLLRKANPRWSFKIRKRKITLYPSIWRENGCKSHFNVQKNLILMVKEVYFDPEFNNDI